MTRGMARQSLPIACLGKPSPPEYYVFLLMRNSVASQASVVWTYWILGTYDVHVDVLAYTTGILRSAESLGFAIAFGIGASKSASLMANLIVAFVVFWVSVPFTTYASYTVKEPGEAVGETSGPAAKDVEDGSNDDIPGNGSYAQGQEAELRA